MGGLLNFVSEGNLVGNGHGVRLKNDPFIKFTHNIFTEIVENINGEDEVLIDGNEKIKLKELISCTFNYELKSDSKNIIVYEVWDLKWLFEDNNFLLNYILDGLTKECYSYLKDNKLKIIISNISEGSIVSDDFFIKFEKLINGIGLNFNNFIFIDSNLNLQYKNSNFKLYIPTHFLTIVPEITGTNQLNYEASTPSIQEASTITKRNKHFLSFNRAERVHRGILLSHLYKNNLLGKFNISALRKFEKPVHFNSDKISHYKKYIDEINSMIPLEIDTEKYKGDIMHFWPGNCFNKNLFLDSYFHLCTETFFFEEDVTYFSEKILKPIIGLQPFILMGTFNYLKQLRKLGFKTFGNIFDESYDDIEDPYDRILKILDLIDEVCSWDLETCEKKYKSVLDICIYNYNHLYNNIKDDYEIFKIIKNISDEW